MDEKSSSKASLKRSFDNFPCLAEKNLVDECYNRTNYDRGACNTPIANYKACKMFWATVRQARLVQGVKPIKPDAEERQKIKDYYLKHRKLPKFPFEPDPS